MLYFIVALLLPIQALKPAIDNSALERLRQAAADSGSSALAVSYDGEVIAEWYFDGPSRPIEIQSITKAVSALAFGAVAGDEGLTLLSKPVAHWFPEWRQGRKKKVLVRHIMAHTTCMQDLASSAEEVAPAPDALALALAADIECDPGTAFHYSNKASNLLAGVFAKAFDLPIDVLAKECLFGPLGIEDYIWQSDANHTPYIMGGLMLTARDLVKIGRLVLDGGEWQGRKIIPKRWIDELAKPGPYHGHGLFWWIAEPSCPFWETRGSTTSTVLVARGWRGQYILVAPSKKLVVVRQYDIRRGIDNVLNDFKDFERLALSVVRSPLCRPRYLLTPLL